MIDRTEIKIGCEKMTKLLVDLRLSEPETKAAMALCEMLAGQLQSPLAMLLLRVSTNDANRALLIRQAATALLLQALEGAQP